jgi:NAD(P)-dependent dehydrogenase (short-subunit alcohol dehydrogenase family)
MTRVWLLTGASRGLGRAIAEAVLIAGDRLLAGARDPRTLGDLANRYPDTLRIAPLDVDDPAAGEAAVRTALDAWGRLDVLVNNAGYGHLMPFEQMGAGDFRAQMETNFFGVVNLTRAVVPIMRRQRSGHIFQVSSVGGRIGHPGLSAYQAAKWAVGGFTEALAQELAPLGIRVTTLEPGGMRTHWGTTAQAATPELWPDYRAAMDPMLALLAEHIGKETGDPAKVAQVILALAGHPNPPVHLLLGSDAVHYCGLAEAARAAVGERWKAVSLAADFGAPEELPAFPQA